MDSVANRVGVEIDTLAGFAPQNAQLRGLNFTADTPNVGKSLKLNG